MKRFVSLVLALVMLFCLAACGKTDKDGEKKDGEKMKVGFICLHDENSTYDLNFINAAKEACEKLGVEAVFKKNIPEDASCKEAALDLADKGCKIVFADSFGHESYMVEAAKEAPDVQFCHATGTTAHTANVKNFHNAFASIYEGRYLAGVAAGLNANAKIDADGHLTSYMADVNADEKHEGDTEVVKDGFFAESTFRSAPYFDLKIDGITLLNTKF